MERHEIELPGWTASVWTEPGSVAPLQDDWLCAHVDGFTRAAVISGAPATDETPSHGETDGGRWAAMTVRRCLERPVDSQTALAAANSILCDLSVKRSRNRPQAYAAVVEFRADGSAVFVRSGDCEMWVSTVGALTPVFAAPCLTDDRPARIERWLDKHVDASAERWFAFENAIAGHSDAWNAAPIGRFPVGKMQVAEFSPVEMKSITEIVLASGDVTLDATRTALLDGLAPAEHISRSLNTTAIRLRRAG